MGRKGYDYFAYDPGEQNSMNCQLCGSVMDVTRNVYGPTSFGEAMGHGSHKHDEFRCPHTREEWHAKALNIIIEAEETASDRLAGMLKEEAQEIIDAARLVKKLRKGDEEKTEEE